MQILLLHLQVLTLYWNIMHITIQIDYYFTTFDGFSYNRYCWYGYEKLPGVRLPQSLRLRKKYVSELKLFF